ncbi:MAG: hypothetical protein B7W98_03345, partial [Parcubacteria group bacterium 20-58-5]
PNISTTAWNSFLSEIAPCGAAANTACTLDPMQNEGVGTTLALAPLSGSPPLYGAQPLYLLSTNGVYTQQNSAGAKQPFTRVILVEPVSGSPIGEERVTTTVSWSFHNTNYLVTVIDHLTPWQ